MDPWVIFLIIFIIIIIIVVIVIIVIRFRAIPPIPNDVLRYGQIIKIRSSLFENGLLSSCAVTDTNCSRRVYVPELLSNLRNPETQTWRLHSDTIDDGQPIRYGDVIYLVPTFNVNLQVGLCGRVSTALPCQETIGLVPINITDGTARWVINPLAGVNPITVGSFVLLGQEVQFLNPSLARTMSVCTSVAGTEGCGGLQSRVVTLLTGTGINDQWLLIGT